MKPANLLKKVILITASLGMITLVVGCSSKSSSAYYSTSKLEMINKYLSSGYLYDIDEISEEEITDSIYTSYVSGLENSATYYLGTDEFKQAEATSQGNYLGVGLMMTWEADGRSVLITDVIPESPAAKAGLKAGDHIIAIDGIEVVGANQKEVLDKLAYTGEQSISYKIKRSADEKEEIINLTVALVPLDDLEYEMINQVGYIKLESIRNGTSEHLDQVIKEFEAQKIKGIILDVRELYTNNVDEVSKMCDLFLDEGIAFKLKHGKSDIQGFEMSSGKYDQKVVLLTDRYTRGGAEAFVSAMQDVAIQMGTDTYGLAYVSELVALEDGSGLNVATGVLYDKFGKQLSDKGIEPDEMVFMTEQEKVEYIEKGSISKENDSLLKKALEQFSN